MTMNLKIPEIKNTKRRTFIKEIFSDAINPPTIAPKNTAIPLIIEVYAMQRFILSFVTA